MARLKAEDVHRIFLRELIRHEERLSLPEEVRNTYKEFMKKELPLRSGASYWSDVKASEVDWQLVVRDVIETYWEVVEEEMNRD